MTVLSVPYVDTRAAELTWAMGLGPLPALDTACVAVPGGSLELRLLGSSHQVILRTGEVEVSEVVACLPDVDGALPRRNRRDLPAATYTFASRVLRPPAPVFPAAVRLLTTWAGARRHRLIGVFPGVPGAVTALTASVGTDPRTRIARWRTWHTYPQTHEIVCTRSEVRWA